MTKTVGIVQARYSSSRLPGKVLRPILGKPLIIHELERIERAKSLDQVILATSTDPSDNPIEEICRQYGHKVARGSLDDVLDRFYVIAKAAHAHTVVRLTGDCPLIDPDVIDAVVEFFRAGYDYASNTIKPTFPDGLDVEVCSFRALEQAWRDAKLGSQREHVTSYFYSNPDKFKLGNWTREPDLGWLRLTVDYEDDFALVQKIYENLYANKNNFDLQDIMSLLEADRSLLALNQSHTRNEGYYLSLKKDQLDASQEGIK